MKMTNQEFDRLLNSIRDEQPEGEQEAATRVRDRLESQMHTSDVCSSFRADFDAFRAGTLAEARRMLLEDHLHSCVACRREFSGDALAPVVPIRSRWVPSRRVVVGAVAALVLIAAGITMPPVLDRALAATGPRGTVASVNGSLVLVSGQTLTPLKVGSPVGEGQEIRTGNGSRAVVRLRDGSTVELAERSDVSLSERLSRKTVHLERGNVMVEAAKQGWRRLEIATADCKVTVKGTIFSVSRGLKGSRVSVVQGEVAVDQGGTTDLLNPGDQTTTSQTMETTSVASDISWSQNAPKYLQLLGELSVVADKIDQIPAPGLRYSSNLLSRVPVNSAAVISLPNLSQTLAEATQIIEDRAKESTVLQEWWSGEAQGLHKALDQIRTVSSYLGDEVLVAVPVNGQPIVLSEVRQQGLADYLTQSGFTGPMAFDGNVVVIGAAAVPPPGGFTATPLGAQILQKYSSGAGMIFAANVEQIMAGNVGITNTSVPNPAAIAGIDNLQFVVAESKTDLGFPDNTALLSFSGPRHGVASWISDPGPMGSLEFISPDASVATTFVTRNPRQLLEELIASAGSEAGAALDTIRQNTGINPLDDLAGTLGGEVTIAVDGAVFPIPSVKVVAEVEDPARLEWSIEQLVATVQQKNPSAGVALTSQDVNGLTYHTITVGQLPVQIHYVFTDGYLLIGPDQALLAAAIQTRASGMSLPHSDAFRNQLPRDGHLDFSALAYYNLGTTVGPVADQLKASGLLTPEQQQQIAAATSNRQPTLVYAYGESDRILVGNRSSFAGLGLNAFSLRAIAGTGLRQ
jgi:FecR protein